MTRTDAQNFTALLDTIAQRHSGGKDIGSADRSTHIPAPPGVKAADIPQEVKDALEPSENGTLDQLNQARASGASGAQRYLAGDIDDHDFNNAIDQLETNSRDEFNQLQDAAIAKLRSIGQEHPDLRQIILSVFTETSDLLQDVGQQELKFLESLRSDPSAQVGKVDGFFNDLTRYLTNGWSQIVG
ncbi:hypothetical protein [Nocardia sp. NPDC049526]|uniref:hypothetical protein n=1 Tax=Nocardia sp. NPDC049526 TaxID=3364316 RepID=UPI003798A190